MKSCVRSGGDIPGLIHGFNLLPARYMDVSWQERVIDPGLFAMLQNSPRGEKRLSSQILKTFDLGGRFHVDFRETALRLALIDPQSLARLILFTGIALDHQRIRTVIQAREQQTVRACLGEDGYFFALKRAPLLAGSIRFSFLPESGEGTPGALAPAWGARCLGALFAGEPRALVDRLRLKLPRDFHMDVDPPVSQNIKATVGNLFKKILLREVNPSWAPLFA